MGDMADEALDRVIDRMVNCCPYCGREPEFCECDEEEY